MMVTLRLEDHIGRVEWVTCHVPESQSVVGGVKLVAGRLDVVGGTRAIWWVMAAMYLVTSTDYFTQRDREAENGNSEGVVCNDPG